MIQKNIRDIRSRIGNSAVRVGRDPSEVTLIAVSKTFDSNVIKQVLTYDQFDFGESYVQELIKKRQDPGLERVKWHFIGPLQRNKVKYLIDFISVIHSVENLKVCEEIEKRASRIGRLIEVLVEINTTGEHQKHGIRPLEAGAFFREAGIFDHVLLRGLMTMAPFADNPEIARPSFRMLAGLRRDLLDQGVPEIQVQHLSMGMSNDFEVAVEEGATMVRIGSSLFGERPAR